VKPSQIVEAILFASDAPLKAEEIARADESLDEDRVEEALQELRIFYDETERAFQISEVAEGYQILTRPDFSTYLERFDTVPRPSRLSGPALETLAIIAYRQPIGRVEVEYIRGVSSSGVIRSLQDRGLVEVIRSLQDRGLVEVVGRGEGLGRPLLYGTTSRFLEHFGFSSLDDLPRPEELPVVLRDRIPLGTDDEDPDQLTLEDEVRADEAAPAADESEKIETPEDEESPAGAGPGDPAQEETREDASSRTAEA
jgi:segregation and condensation protein B